MAVVGTVMNLDGSDTQEQIQMCLNCTQDVCSNCLAFSKPNRNKYVRDVLFKRRMKAYDLHIMGGVTYEKTAETLGVSYSTAVHDVVWAREWKKRENRNARKESEK